MELKGRTYYFVLIATLFWCLLIILPTLIGGMGESGKIISGLDYKFFNHVCHQYDQRSLHIGEYKFAVCARCTGIYYGFLLGLIVLPYVKTREFKNFKVVFLIIALPMVVDVLLDTLGIHSSNLFTRAMTGLLFGIPSAVLLFPSLREGIEKINKTKRIDYVQ
jgi:uncharacterized membrane protein